MKDTLARLSKLMAVVALLAAMLQYFDFGERAIIMYSISNAVINRILFAGVVAEHMLWSLRRAHEIPPVVTVNPNIGLTSLAGAIVKSSTYFSFSWQLWQLFQRCVHISTHRNAMFAAIGLCRVPWECLQFGPSWLLVAPSLQCLAWWWRKMHMSSMVSCRLLSFGVALALSDNAVLAALPSATAPAYGRGDEDREDGGGEDVEDDARGGETGGEEDGRG